jgi:hypothetical protein
MTRPRPLFVTGTARSGSNLLGRMLSANREVAVACDPYLPLFLSLRNALLEAAGAAAARAGFDPRAPLQDYYFDEGRLAAMDAIQHGDLDVAYDIGDWPRLRQALAIRAAHECGDLVPHLDRVRASTYRGLVDNGLALIGDVRRATDRRWVGFKEVWTIEFFAALARAYPDASFIVLLRDPRAVIASMHAIDHVDAAQVAHTLSYARHWRKNVAFAHHYTADAGFAGRLMVLTYEELVQRPDATARALCDFLGVGFDDDMLAPDRYVDPATGQPWRGNSSFVSILAGISQGQAERWRTAIDPRALRLVEFVCGPEMGLAGYEPATDGAGLEPELLQYVIANGRQRCSWRSDFGDPQRDHGFELFRRALLEADEAWLDPGLVRRSFLFEDVFRAVRPVGSAVR